jgi:hypothetical protein
MKLLPWLVVLLLVGCSTNQSAMFEEKLNAYAVAAADPKADLEKHLSGAALESAIEARELLLELGLSQLGISKFSKVSVSGENQVTGCLDVSKVSFVDEELKPVNLEGRIERQKILASFLDENGKSYLARLEVGLGSC